MSTLTVVIPALNEEEAIGATIERSLAARDTICRVSGADDVEIIVVSDGSTDRTAEIARGYADVTVIEFPVNRGYGAAIKAGFRRGRGEFVAFLDADGTCDPLFFAPLLQELQRRRADVALGSRLGPDSKMPGIRRLGNRIYALLLGLLCGQSVTDTASGMRIVRRAALDDLYPLPDGLHFTPAMSARALLSGMRICEVPMPYEERVGRSKLSVVRDGLRFFGAIFEGALWYRPERLFLFGFVGCLLLGLLLAAHPVEFYFRQRHLEEWMIYRFIACFLLGSAGMVLLAAGTLAHRIVITAEGRRATARFWPELFEQLFTGRTFWTLFALAVVCSTALIGDGFAEFLTTGHISTHWSRVMIAAFGYLAAFIAAVTSLLLRVLRVRETAERVMNAGDIDAMQADADPNRAVADLPTSAGG